ncbi:MAG: hypothetical protein IPQ07_10955 [Myxococcales bacterium]|nr:hypothetical protein [Myxococcales bacterium]
MWRFLRKRRALRAFRTRLFRHLRMTYGRKLFYSTDEVRESTAWLRINDEFVCFAFAMFCDQATFDAHHLANGEACDYAAMRSEVFAHVANVPVTAGTVPWIDGHDGHGAEHHGGHHDSGHHVDSGHHGHDWGGFDGGGCDSGGGFDGGGGHGGHCD